MKIEDFKFTRDTSGIKETEVIDKPPLDFSGSPSLVEILHLQGFNISFKVGPTITIRSYTEYFVRCEVSHTGQSLVLISSPGSVEKVDIFNFLNRYGADNAEI